MTVLKDALYNLHPDSGTDPVHARGILVGVVATIMEEKGLNWEDAIWWISSFLPDTVMADAVPESWQNKLGEYRSLVSD